MSKQRVLGTGGTGYIASHVVLSLFLTQKYDIVIIDNYHNSSSGASKSITQLAAKLLPNAPEPVLDVYAIDLAERDQVEGVFKAYENKGGIWGVVHIAAHKAVGESMEHPIQYFRNNISGLTNLLEVMEKYKTYNIVYSSSATVYGEPEKMPITEDMPLIPQSVYGRTKFMGEIMIKDVCDAHPDLWKGISLRYFNPAGAHPSGLIGEAPRGKPLNLLPLLAARAQGKYNDSPLKVFGTDYPTPDGACVRDYLHVMDLADGHTLSLQALDPSHPRHNIFSTPSRDLGFGTGKGKYKAYNLGTGKGESAIGIINAMKAATGYNFEYEVGPRRAGDVPWLIADPTLAEKELGFKATKNLETMCKDLWNWQKGHPDGYETKN